MQTKLFLLLLCSLGINTFAQTFTLSYILNDKGKTFKSGGFYEIILAENEEALKNNCCEWTTLKGSLSSVTEDSFQMNLKSYEQRAIVDDVKIFHENYAKEGSNFGSFSQQDIFSIRHYKSEKSRKRKNAFSGAGGVLIFTGVVTAINALIVKDDDSKKDILQSGGVQVGAGLAFVIMGNSKRYKLKGKDGNWQLR